MALQKGKTGPQHFQIKRQKKIKFDDILITNKAAIILAFIVNIINLANSIQVKQFILTGPKDLIPNTQFTCLDMTV